MELRSDRRGRVPFAVVGVLILVSASGAGVYLGSQELGANMASDAISKQSRAERACMDEIRAIGLAASLASQSAMEDSLLPGAGSPDSHFQERMGEWFASRYPRRADGFTVNATLSECVLLADTARMPGASGGFGRAIPWEAEHLLKVAVSAESGGVRHVVNESVEGQTPARGLAAAGMLNALSAAVAPGGAVESTARSLMCLLAQKRLAEGWGAGKGKPGIGEVLTQVEARKAYEVAVRAECAKLCGADPATGIRYASAFDAGDLFLSELNEVGLDTSLLLSQALAGLLDQILLKYYEYLGMAGRIGEIIALLDKVEGWFESVWDEVAGDGGEAERLDAAVSWIREVVDCAGLDISCLEMTGSRPLMHVYPGNLTLTARNASGGTVTLFADTSLVLNLLPYDMLEDDAWAEIFPSLEDSYEAGKPGLSRMLNDLVVGLAGGEVSIIPLVLDECDGLSAADELSVALSEALADSSLVREAVKNAATGFLEGQGGAMVDLGSWMESKEGRLTDPCIRPQDSLAQTAKYYVEDHPPAGLDGIACASLADDLFDAVWEASGAKIEEAYRDAIMARFHSVADGISSARTPAGSSDLGWLAERVICMVIDGAPGIKSLAQWLDGYVAEFGKDFVDAIDFGGTQTWVEPSSGQVEIIRWSGAVESTAGVLLRFSGTDSMEFSVSPPDECPGSVHYTDPKEASPTPYVNRWTVEICGALEISSSVDGTEAATACAVDSTTAFSAASLWGLDGVDYTPTSTISGDMLSFISEGFNSLAPSVNRAIDGCRTLWRLLSEDFFPWIMAEGPRLAEQASSLLFDIVGTLQDALKSVLSAVFSELISELLEPLGTRTFSFSLYGLPITVTTLPVLPGPKRFFTLSSSWGEGGLSLKMCAELLELEDGDLDFVFRSEASGADGEFTLCLDPLMEHLGMLASVKGKAGGMGFDICVPSAEQHETLEMSLQDIPGAGSFLSNIPIPGLGISADIDAGFSIDFSPPSATGVVFNEYEANPPGTDAGNEAVELFNPLPAEVSLEGWTIETSGGVKVTRELSGTIRPGTVLAVRFDQQTLDNRDDAVILRNACGNIVDETPHFKDETDSGRSWGREYDGWGAWAWGKSSIGTLQGELDQNASLVSVAADLLYATIEEAVQEILALESFSMDSIMRVVREMTERFESRIAVLIESAVKEASLFLELLLGDATGSGGLGYRIEVALDGRGCAEAFLWLAGEVERIAGLILDPGSGGFALSAPSSLLPHVSVVVDNLVELEIPAQLPDAVKNAGIPDKLQARQTIAFTLPLIGQLAGRSWGPWSATIGLRAMDFPAQAAALVLDVDENLPVELWLVRAVLYEA